MLTAEAEITGDFEALARLLCPECGQPVLPGGRRRRDARYCSGTCRTRAWRHRRLPLEDREEPVGGRDVGPSPEGRPRRPVTARRHGRR
ncbi:hypothetical protein ACN24M_39445 [Streptomyces microflavus]|uniref:hypothetical protein n=1 Tax=Streptomyces microflavus TaxID=1919 RepID=UPI003B21A291